MATNRFVCEVCNKGFQREQNLQLHRRGHNLPWKLRQKSTKEVRRKVYLCPEPTCVHHDPARALGDLTGIKKHYSRKHGEKKYKCEKCSKKYAVQSDWKAHSKTCGTREYRCDCGTLFSRRDSFITHRAFCDALAQESARNMNPPSLNSIGSHLLGLSQMSTDHHNHNNHNHNHNQINQSLSNHDMLRLGGGSRPGPQFETLVGSGFRPARSSLPPPSPALYTLQQQSNEEDHHQHNNGMLSNKASSSTQLHGLMQLPQLHNNAANNSTSNSSTAGLFNLSFFPPGNSVAASNIDGGHHSGGGGDQDSTLFSSGNLMSMAIPSLYSTSLAIPNPSGGGTAHMSATALLQKAAQLGSTTANSGASSLLKSFGKSSDDHHSIHGHSFIGGGTAATTGFGENDNGGSSHLHDLVNSIAAGGGGGSASIFGGEIDDYRSSSGIFHGGGNSSNQGGGFSSLEQGRLTRDFLGVGEIVRSVREQQQQQNAAMDSQSQAFGGGSNFR
ncbi:hypothetical protein ABFS83_05G055000 [Erythranthe nasuta]